MLGVDIHDRQVSAKLAEAPIFLALTKDERFAGPEEAMTAHRFTDVPLKHIGKFYWRVFRLQASGVPSDEKLC